jgi:type IV secretory pathway ATPase VirB11/archaellum biosynthesis ATPase
MPKKAPCSYEIEREDAERSLVVTCQGCMYYPSIEDNEICMERTVDKLIEAGHLNLIILSAERNYIYSEEQTSMLNEIADAYVHLVKDKKILTYRALGARPSECTKCYPVRFHFLRSVVLDLLKKDPIGAYVTAIRRMREIRAMVGEAKEMHKPCLEVYSKLLSEVISTLEKTELIKRAKPEIPGYKLGEREIYRKIFEPMIRPNFMFTRLMAEPPTLGEEVESYTIGAEEESDVVIYRIPGEVKPLYHILPPELKLREEEYSLLDEAREILVRYKPREEEFVDPRRMRRVFFSISRDLIEEIARSKGLEIEYKDVEKLARILVRLTVGFGLVEVLLQDEQVEDIYINAPVGTTPIFVKHSKYRECETNVTLNIREAEAWASRFRMISGRPLDEANPVLDTDLIIPGARARVCVIQNPLSPRGLSFAFRRHRARPWTLPLFIDNKFISPLGAGLLWFLVDGARTMLVAGTRGSGKTSLLGALMTEIMRKFRFVTVEDTLELPTDYLREIGYNIVPMKVRSAIVGEKAEMSAEEGIRTAIRLGDSCLIIGEVRSTEAISLYEAMRIGALANVVAGTIHAESAYGVFDRVVNDLGVPRTSFKATDIVVICNTLKSPDLLTEFRRVTAIVEVRKHWEEDPLKEKGFVTLMEYNAKEDELKPTKNLIEGETEVVKAIAGRVREWAGNWDRVWENILLRTKVKQMLVDYARKTGNREILEADFVVQANEQFHRIFERLKKEGYPKPKDVLYEFEDWLKVKVKS